MTGAAETTVVRGLAYGPDPAHRFDLYQPLGRERPWPTVISIRGGGWRDGRRDDPRMVQWVAQPLVERGFAVAAIDYRHAPEHPFPAQSHDARQAVDHLRGHAEALGLDADHFAVVGGSAGGHLAALLAVTPGHRLDAVVLLLAPVDLRRPRYLEALPDDVARAALRKVLDELIAVPWSEDRQPWLDASPLLHVSPATAPCFVFHGTEDEVVPVRQARDLVAALRAAGVRTESCLVEGLGHDLDEHPARQPAVARALDRAWCFLEAAMAPEAPRAW